MQLSKAIKLPKKSTATANVQLNMKGGDYLFSGQLGESYTIANWSLFSYKAGSHLLTRARSTRSDIPIRGVILSGNLKNPCLPLIIVVWTKSINRVIKINEPENELFAFISDWMIGTPYLPLFIYTAYGASGPTHPTRPGQPRYSCPLSSICKHINLFPRFWVEHLRERMKSQLPC